MVFEKLFFGNDFVNDNSFVFLEVFRGNGFCNVFLFLSEDFLVLFGDRGDIFFF